MKQPLIMTSRILAGLLTLILAFIVLFGVTASAQTTGERADHDPPVTLGEVLGPDGKISPGAVGGFSASGFEMTLDNNGAPRFAPSASRQNKKAASRDAGPQPETRGGRPTKNLSPAVGAQSCLANFDPRLYASGTYDDDSFYHVPSVNAVAIDASGNIFVGGRFSSIDNVITGNIARYDHATGTWATLANGGIDPGFGPNVVIEALLLSGNDLFVGGKFTKTADSAVNFRNIARYDIAVNQWSPLAGNGLINSNIFDGTVRAFAISGNSLFVGGEFTKTFDGTTAGLKGIARFDLIANTWSMSGKGLSDGFGTGYVNALTILGGDLYVGGFFKQTENGATTGLGRIARLNIAAETWSALANGGLSFGSVKAIAISGGSLFVAGDFNQTADETNINLWGIARFDPGLSAWFELTGNGLSDGPFTSSVEALLVSGNTLYVGGEFTQTRDGTTIGLENIGAYDIAAATWSALPGNGLAGREVDTLVMSGSDLIVGGRFTATVSGSTGNLNNLATYNNGVWSPLGTNNGSGMIGLNSLIYAVAVDSNGYVYVGGTLAPAYAGAVTNLNHIARYDPGSGNWAALTGDGLNNTVFALAINGNELFAGGNFTATGDGTTATGLNGIARYNLQTLDWSPLDRGGVNGDVMTLLVAQNELFVGGLFTQTADSSINLNRIARYDLITPGGHWTAFANNGLNSAVSSLAISVNYLFVGGSFSETADGLVTTLHRIARYNLTPGNNVWSPLDGNGMNAPVNALAVSGSELFVGGFFTQTFDGTTTDLNRIARYNIVAPSGNWAALAGNGLNNAVYALAISGNKLFLGGSFTSTTDLAAVVTRVAGYNTTTNAWAGPSTGSGGLGYDFLEVNADVRSLAISGNDLIVGGVFTRVATCGVARFLTRHYLKQWSSVSFRTGGSGTDWFDGSNWTDGTAPAANTNAFVPANAGNISITSADVTMHDLLLTGGTLTIGAGRTLTINGILGLSSTINGAGTLIVTSCKPGAIVGDRTGKFIQTALVRCVDNSGTFNFPVGTMNGYSPVQLSKVAGTANFTVKANQGAYSAPAAGLPPGRLLRYWDLANGGITSADVRFNYLPGDVVGTESANRLFRINAGVAQDMGGVVDPVFHSSFITGVTGFSPWTLANLAPTAAEVSVSGRVFTPDGRALKGALVTLTDTGGLTLTALSGPMGYYRFDGIAAGESYIMGATSKRYQFGSRLLPVIDELTGLDLTALP